jgi:hypothetical protein
MSWVAVRALCLHSEQCGYSVADVPPESEEWVEDRTWVVGLGVVVGIE